MPPRPPVESPKSSAKAPLKGKKPTPFQRLARRLFADNAQQQQPQAQQKIEAPQALGKTPKHAIKNTPKNATKNALKPPTSQNPESTFTPTPEELAARKREMIFLKKRREQKRVRLFYSRLRHAIRIVCFFALAYGLYLTAINPHWVFASPNTLPQPVQIIFPNSAYQTHLLSARELTPLFKPALGRPIYQIDPQTFEKNLKQKFPLLSDVVIRRQLLPVMQLQAYVTEKKPWAELYATPEAIKAGPKTLAVTDSAAARPTHQLLDLKPYPEAPEQLASLKLPKIIVASASTPFTLKPDDRQKFWQQIKTLCFQLQSFSGLQLNYLDVRNPNEIQAEFLLSDPSESVLLKIGRLDLTYPERLARLYWLLPKINQLAGKIDSVDLRWGGQMTFHKKTSQIIAPPPKAQT